MLTAQVKALDSGIWGEVSAQGFCEDVYGPAVLPQTLAHVRVHARQLAQPLPAPVHCPGTGKGLLSRLNAGLLQQAMPLESKPYCENRPASLTFQAHSKFCNNCSAGIHRKGLTQP